MSDYKHGTYGELVPVSTAPTTSPSCVVYVGTAPAHKIKGQAENQAGLFNLPLKITSVQSARKLLGYSEEAPFEKYTLCEAVEAHFKNSIENIGPIYCINVFDPNLSDHYVEDEEGTELTVLKKQAKFVLGDLMLDSIQIEVAKENVTDPKPTTPPEEEGQEPVEGEGGEENPSEDENISTQSEEAVDTSNTVLVEGEDYNLAYDSMTDTVTLVFKGEEIPTKILVKGKVVNPASVSATDIIGEVTPEGKKTGLQAVQDMYRLHDEITNIICAPAFSAIPEVYEAMCQVALKLNGHWSAFVCADVPLEEDGVLINTRQKAYEWAEDNGYINGRSGPCWPLGVRPNGKNIHLSTVLTAKLQALDTAANGVPYQSPSNKRVDLIGLYGGKDFVEFDQEEANELNEHGIMTAIRLGGAYRLWGSHTGAYSYEDEESGTVDPTTRFITSIRTMMHITNRFQADNFDLIDQPMTNALKDFIIQKEQSKLDALVSIGALLGQPKIYFSEDNSPKELMGGNFVWDISATTGIPFKSGTVRLGYTDAGVYTLLGEEE